MRASLSLYKYRFYSVHLIVWKTFWYIVIVCLVIRWNFVQVYMLSFYLMLFAALKLLHPHTHIHTHVSEPIAEYWNNDGAICVFNSVVRLVKIITAWYCIREQIRMIDTYLAFCIWKQQTMRTKQKLIIMRSFFFLFVLFVSSLLVWIANHELNNNTPRKSTYQQAMN